MNVNDNNYLTELFIEESKAVLDANSPSGGGGGLPVVELETVATANMPTLTEADAAKMEAIAGAVCILKMPIKYNGMQFQIAAVSGAMNSGDGTYYYIAQTPLGSVQINNESNDGSWCAVLVTSGV